MNKLLSKTIALLCASLIALWMLMHAFGYHYLIGNQYQQNLDAVDALAQKLERQIASDELDEKNWQSMAVKNPDLELMLYNMSEIDPNDELRAILKPLAVGKSYIDVNNLNCYFKLSPSHVLEVIPLIDVSSQFEIENTVLLMSFLLAALTCFIPLIRQQQKAQHLISELKKHHITIDPNNNESEAQQIINQFEQQQQKVVDKGLLQRDLLHGVAHELRSPLSRMQFALDMLPQTENPEHKQLFRQLDNELSELDNMAAELLSYARLEFMEKPLQFKHCILSDLITASLNKVTPHYPQIQFVNDIQQAELYCDEGLMVRAFSNILRNAGRFATTTVRISSWHDKTQVFIAIEDDGPGIPPGKISRIFEPFTRLDPSRSRDSGGVGLGLAITHSIVMRHHGKIDVLESKLTGANFRLQFSQAAHSDLSNQ